jgi:hypothetical protein
VQQAPLLLELLQGAMHSNMSKCHSSRMRCQLLMYQQSSRQQRSPLNSSSSSSGLVPTGWL